MVNDPDERQAETGAAAGDTASGRGWSRRAVAFGLGAAGASAWLGFVRRQVLGDAPLLPGAAVVPRASPDIALSLPPGLIDADDGLVELASLDVPLTVPRALPPAPSLAPADPGPRVPRALPPLARPASGRAQVAVVIDDLGLKQAETLAATRLPAGMTLAFLPYGDNLEPHLARARDNGHERLVHLPMEAGPGGDPGPQALLTRLGQADLEQRLAWNMERIHLFDGVNNHMGSVFTQWDDGMALVLAELKARGVYFLDSRTTARSVARDVAATRGVPYAERDVFLDNHRDARYLGQQLAQTEALARRFGSAIAIGHPHGETVAALARWAPTLADRGIELVPVSTVIATRGSPYWRLARG